MRTPGTKARAVAAAATAAGMLGGIVISAPARADDAAARLGQFTQPFREDAFSRPGTDGCVADAAGKKSCLPPGATLVNLPDGRILYWNALEGIENATVAVANGGEAISDAQSRVLSLNSTNPAASSWLTPNNPGASFPSYHEPTLVPGDDNQNATTTDSSLFCSDQVVLADGRVVSFGGTNYYTEPEVLPGTGVIELEGVRLARQFDPKTNEWSKVGEMAHGRWYPGKVTLPDGKVLVTSGVTKLLKPVYPSHPLDSGTNVKQTETFDPKTGTFSENPASADKSLPLFPRLHLLPNGHVYYGAGGQNFNPFGQSYDEALWNMASTYDPATQRWSDLGVPGLDARTLVPPNLGTPSEVGFRGSTFQQMLPLKAPYASASFLTAGGTFGTSPGSYVATAASRIDKVDTAGSAEKLSSYKTGPLSENRWYPTGVSLPTGQVLAFSGATVDHVILPGSEQAIKKVELFTPNGTQTGGSWQTLATQSQERTYHNNAILLPDGRVLVGGHDPISTGYFRTMTLPEVPGVIKPANNTKDASFEVFSPPYLFWGPRPAIGGRIAGDLQRGSSLRIPTADAKDIASVVLVRNAAQTHLIDGDQRTVELPITSRGTDGLTVGVPGSTAVLPAGPYMLFINKTSPKGLIPSVAKEVTVGLADQAASPATGGRAVPTSLAGAATSSTSSSAGAAPATGAGVVGTLGAAMSAVLPEQR